MFYYWQEDLMYIHNNDSNSADNFTISKFLRIFFLILTQSYEGWCLKI